MSRIVIVIISIEILMLFPNILSFTKINSMFSAPSWRLQHTEHDDNFVHQRHFITRISSSRSDPIVPVQDGVTLINLKNTVYYGALLNSSISSWLNEEYITLPVHYEIGIEVSKCFTSYRNQGIIDLGDMLINIGTHLESFDFKDAFVNAWDIANKSSELLMTYLDNLSHHTNNDKKIPELLEKYDETVKNLESEFDRYKLLRDFLDGELGLSDLALPVMITLGYRKMGSNNLIQQAHLAPTGWELSLGEDAIPDITDFNDDFINAKMEADISQDIASTDIIMEALAGYEMSKQFEASSDVLIKHKIRIAKWLFLFGFLYKDFPLTERYIPANIDAGDNDME